LVPAFAIDASWGVIIIRSAGESNEDSRGNGCVRVMPLG
jgi:hypothetical protein